MTFSSSDMLEVFQVGLSENTTLLHKIDMTQKGAIYA